MYGIFAYICAILGVNIGKYSIHGAYGMVKNPGPLVPILPASVEVQAKQRGEGVCELFALICKDIADPATELSMGFSEKHHNGAKELRIEFWEHVIVVVVCSCGMFFLFFFDISRWRYCMNLH